MLIILRSYLLIKAEPSVYKYLVAVRFKLLYVSFKILIFHSGVLCILIMEHYEAIKLEVIE